MALKAGGTSNRSVVYSKMAVTSEAKKKPATVSKTRHCRHPFLLELPLVYQSEEVMSIVQVKFCNIFLPSNGFTKFGLHTFAQIERKIKGVPNKVSMSAGCMLR